MVEIRTNHHLYYGKHYPYDMTKHEQRQVESAYGGLIELDDAEFVFYRGYPYFMGDCLRTSQFGAYWHGYFDETFFSAVIVHIDSENDGYVFGYAIAKG